MLVEEPAFTIIPIIYFVDRCKYVCTCIKTEYETMHNGFTVLSESQCE